MTISVAMAVYNGERYLVEQIESILPQLNDNDELVISINPSSDNSENIVKKYANKDKRIRVINCDKKGVLSNFENAIINCNNDIIFLSDQDDIWVENKIRSQLSYFEDSSIGGVCHGCLLINEKGIVDESQSNKSKSHFVKFSEVIIKNPVQGSTLAFRKDLCKFFLPFPKQIPMHDSWIGICICKKYKLLYLSEPYLLYRQHEGTVTQRKHKSVVNMFKDRFYLFISYLMFMKNNR